MSHLQCEDNSLGMRHRMGAQVWNGGSDINKWESMRKETISVSLA